MKTYRYGGCSIPIQMKIYLSNSDEGFDQMKRPHPLPNSIYKITQNSFSICKRNLFCIYNAVCMCTSGDIVKSQNKLMLSV